jgi:4-hydroxybenzoate polyprenyltransferase
MLWIAGLDVVYALQDMDFDRKEGLFSIPARYGRERALAISSTLYIAATGALAAAGILTARGIPYWAGVFCVAIIFFKQQQLARSEDLGPAIQEFFHINRYISPILFVGTFIDVFVK